MTSGRSASCPERTQQGIIASKAESVGRAAIRTQRAKDAAAKPAVRPDAAEALPV